MNIEELRTELAAAGFGSRGNGADCILVDVDEEDGAEASVRVEPDRITTTLPGGTMTSPNEAIGVSHIVDRFKQIRAEAQAAREVKARNARMRAANVSTVKEIGRAYGLTLTTNNGVVNAGHVERGGNYVSIETDFEGLTMNVRLKFLGRAPRERVEALVAAVLYQGDDHDPWIGLLTQIARAWKKG